MSALRIGVALLVLSVWAAAWIISFADRSYTVPGSLTAPAMLAIGFLLGSEIRNQLRGSRDERKDTDER